LAFLIKEITALKKQVKPDKTATTKKRNTESLLSTEINLSTGSDKDECFVSYPTFFRYNKSKLAKISHPTTELLMKKSLTIHHEEYWVRGWILVPATSLFLGHTPQNS
jgi:hypothetical protein